MIISQQFSVLMWSPPGTEELKRKEAFESADPVYAALLTDFVRERLSQAQHMGMGPYWAKLDADVQRQLEKLMS